MYVDRCHNITSSDNGWVDSYYAWLRMVNNIADQLLSKCQIEIRHLQTVWTAATWIQSGIFQCDAMPLDLDAK